MAHRDQRSTTTQSQVQVSMLKSELGKAIKDNNSLQMTIIRLRQTIESLQGQIHKQNTTQKASDGTNIVQDLKDRLFKETKTEAQHWKFKYNELVDFLHGQPDVQRKYVRRFIPNHTADVNSSALKEHKQKNDTARRQSHDSSEQKGSVKEETKTSKGNSYLEDKKTIKLLESKVANRQAEIMRLQGRLQSNGLNMNRLLQEFIDSNAQSREEALQKQVEDLVEGNGKMRQELFASRNKGGIQEALRKETEKTSTKLKEVKRALNQSQRNEKERKFDAEMAERQAIRVKAEAKSQVQKAQMRAKFLEQQLVYQCQQLKRQIDLLSKENESLKAGLRRVASQMPQNDE